MGGGTRGVAFVAGKAECCREHREVVHPRELPHLLDIPRDVLGSMIDLEAIVGLRSPRSGHRIEEPVRIHHVLDARARGAATDRPESRRPPQEPLAARRREHPVGRPRRQRGERSRSRAESQGAAFAAFLAFPEHGCRAQDWGANSGLICWDAHRLRRTWSEIRHLTSEADIFDSRRRRHSSSTAFMIQRCPAPFRSRRRTS